MADEPTDLVLIHLQGLRREMAALLERQLRDRELVSKVFNELMAFRTEVREELRDIKSDVIHLENQMVSRHNEILGVIRRLDEIGTPSE